MLHTPPRTSCGGVCHFVREKQMGVRRLWSLTWRSLRAHALLVAVALVTVAAGWIVPWLWPMPIAYTPALYVTGTAVMTTFFLAIAGAAYVVYVMIFVRPERLTRYLVAVLTTRILTSERLIGFLITFLLIPLVISSYTYFKVLIPSLNAFSWDESIAEWDRLLHGGHQAWELLQPVLGYPYITAVINVSYHLWIFVLYFVLLWQAFSTSRPRLRMQYLITFALLWPLVGNLAATILSSVGPVYYGRVTGLPDPFAPLMAYLHQAAEIVPVPALAIQEDLWQSYIAGGAGIGRGISAMPSMHLATSFSFVLLAFSTDRRLGWAFLAFCALIFIGSVHLGWHYAIDGYVAIAATWLIWRAVGWLLERPTMIWLLWGSSAAVSVPRAENGPVIALSRS
jgi:hypothetical protein